jgi:predicted ABC-type ATPase
MEKEKWVWIVVGPNGAGKSTVWGQMGGEFASIPYFDPDREARAAYEKLGANPQQSIEDMYVKVSRDFERNRVEEYRRQGQSFALEQGAPGRFTKSLVKKFKAEGWKIGVIIVGVADKQQAEQRAQKRGETGGHWVWPHIFELSYHGVIERTPAMMAEADRALIIDNSGEKPVLIAERERAGEPLKFKVSEEAIDANNSFLRTLLMRLREQNLLESPGR